MVLGRCMILVSARFVDGVDKNSRGGWLGLVEGGWFIGGLLLGLRCERGGILSWGMGWRSLAVVFFFFFFFFSLFIYF